MDRENVDTDAIIPKQFLKSIRKTGFGINLFDEWRYLDVGFPGQDPASRKPNPDFVLNQPRFAGASVLLARKNFGCGSSREHAPWALEPPPLEDTTPPLLDDDDDVDVLPSGSGRGHPSNATRPNTPHSFIRIGTPKNKAWPLRLAKNFT